jgi:hypothetical protein
MSAILDYSSAEPDAITGERLFTTEAQRHREKHRGKQTAGARRLILHRANVLLAKKLSIAR